MSVGEQWEEDVPIEGRTRFWQFINACVLALQEEIAWAQQADLRPFVMTFSLGMVVYPIGEVVSYAVGGTVLLSVPLMAMFLAGICGLRMLALLGDDA